MIQRLGRTLYERTGRYIRDPERPELPPTYMANRWQAVSALERAIQIENARAILSALREPTEAMRRAGLAACDGDEAVLDGWEAMIAAALAEADAPGGANPPDTP